MEQENILDIGQLVADDKNFNKGNDEGRKLMEKSFSELGAGRSILLDKDNRIIAGNKSTEAAIATGIKKVRVIETTGDELVAVKRIDIDLDSEEGRKMALADNATQQVNLSWDETQLAAVADEIGGFDPSEWGVETYDENFDFEMPQNLKEHGFIDGIRGLTNLFQVTFAFDKQYQECVNNYIKIHTKADLEQKIIEICQSAEAK